MTAPVRSRRRSRAIVYWRAENGFDSRGQPVTVDGRGGLFTRASTATAVDSRHESYVLAPHLPARSLLGGRVALEVRPAADGRAVESCVLQIRPRLGDHTGYVRFHLAEALTSARALLHWGDPAVTTADAWASLPLSAESGWFEACWSVAADGAVSLSGAVDGGPVLPGLPAPATADVLVPAARTLFLGGRGTLEVAGAGLDVVAILPGAHSLLTLRAMCQ